MAGFLGLHRFYLGCFWTGLLMLVTLGGFGIWWVVDVFLILTGKLRDGDKQELAWFGGGSQPDTLIADAPTSQPREASEQTQTSEAEPTSPDEEARGTADMSTISLPGQTKVSTLQERFKSEFGLTLRVYDGRSFAEPDATIGQVRKKRGATSIVIRRNTKVGNLEDRFMEDFGIKVQIAGSDDSYLCSNDLTLAAALVEDERKLGRKATRAAADEGQDPDAEHNEIDNMSDIEPPDETMEVIITSDDGDEHVYWVDISKKPEGEDEYDWSIAIARAYHEKHVGTEIEEDWAAEPFSREADEFTWVNKF